MNQDSSDKPEAPQPPANKPGGPSGSNPPGSSSGDIMAVGGANPGTGLQTTSMATRGNDLQQLAFAVAALAQATGTANPALNRINDSLNKLEDAMKAGNTKLEAANQEKSKDKGKQKQQNLKELKTQLGQEKRKLLGKTVAATITPSLVVASSAIGVGAGDAKVAAGLITAGDYIAEAIGKAAAQTGIQEPIINTMIKVDEYNEYHQSTTIGERGRDFVNKVSPRSENRNPKGGKGAAVSQEDSQSEHNIIE